GLIFPHRRRRRERMSLGTWIKSLFGITPSRDVSRLSQDAGSTTTELDVIEERINTSGGPLKEHHRRRALRDKRLWPKAKPPVRFVKRKNILSLAEGHRLFGA